MELIKLAYYYANDDNNTSSVKNKEILTTIVAGYRNKQARRNLTGGALDCMRSRDQKHKR